MYKIDEENLKNALKPFDVVKYNGEFGFVSEVSVNSSQPEAKHQISYSVTWLTKNLAHNHVAWFQKEELEYQEKNIFILIAEGLCHPFGTGEKYVKTFFNYPAEKDRGYVNFSYTKTEE